MKSLSFVLALLLAAPLAAAQAPPDVDHNTVRSNKVGQPVADNDCDGVDEDCDAAARETAWSFFDILVHESDARGRVTLDWTDGTLEQTDAWEAARGRSPGKATPYLYKTAAPGGGDDLGRLLITATVEVDGRPAPGYTVMAFRETRRPDGVGAPVVALVVTDASGGFSLQVPDDGSAYRLTISEEGVEEGKEARKKTRGSLLIVSDDEGVTAARVPDPDGPEVCLRPIDIVSGRAAGVCLGG